MTAGPVDSAAKPGPIVVGYDGRDGGRDALALGEALGRASGADLLVASAYPEAEHHATIVAAGEVEAAMRAEAEAALRSAVAELALPTAVRTLAIGGSSPAAALHRAALAEGAAMIVLGSPSHGRLGRLLLGSTGERLLHGAPCAVGVAPRGFADARSHELAAIGAGYDGSVEASFALAAAVELARATRATLTLLAVVEHPVPMSPALGAGPEQPAGNEAFDRLVAERREQSRRALDAIEDGFDARAELLAGDPGEELARAADAQELDLLVVGSRGYGPIRTVLLGGVGSGLIHTAPCPVLVVPRGGASDSGAPGSAGEDV